MMPGVVKIAKVSPSEVLMRFALIAALTLSVALGGASAQSQEFDPKGWTTVDSYAAIGDPNAKRVAGSRITVPWETWPPTMRTDGPNSNLTMTTIIHNAMYESLVQLHPETKEYIPYLATHWKIETADDKKTQTFSFHINPKAKWADGSPVTAEDVKASWLHRTREDRSDPSNRMTFLEGYQEPQVIDKLTIKVTTKELNWRLFLYFGGMAIFPAKEVGVDGKTYLDDWNWKLWMPSGPYSLKEEDVKKGDSVILNRRNDWWGEQELWGRNCFNWDQIKFLVVRDQELQYEMFKKGDLDWYNVNRAKRWVDEMPKEEIFNKGWAQRRKIYNDRSRGFGGLAFNMREEPFKDKRVRLAIAHLFNREKLFKEVFYNEYEYLSTYFPGGGWGADNERIKFDPDKAEELLEEAGYKKRDDDGYLIGPDGKRFELNLDLSAPIWETIFKVIQPDFKAAGIQLNLKVIDWSTIVRKISDRQFRIHMQSWGGIAFPNPETSWRSSLADQSNNNNITGFKNEKVDQLCKDYNVAFERAEQRKIVQEIDRLIYAEHPFALGWYGPYERVAFWDKFGYPQNYLSRYGIGNELSEEMIARWWYDPVREKAMLAAREKGESLPQGPLVVKPWAEK